MNKKFPKRNDNYYNKDNCKKLFVMAFDLVSFDKTKYNWQSKTNKAKFK